jgi:hypothetical protein
MENHTRIPCNATQFRGILKCACVSSVIASDVRGFLSASSFFFLWVHVDSGGMTDNPNKKASYDEKRLCSPHASVDHGTPARIGDSEIGTDFQNTIWKSVCHQMQMARNEKRHAKPSSVTTNKEPESKGCLTSVSIGERKSSWKLCEERQLATIGSKR